MKTLTRKYNRATTKHNYKNVVLFYDVWSNLTESKAAKKVLKFAQIKEGIKILEVACGTGIVFKQLVRQNLTGKNLGVDLSPHMLAKAKTRMKNIKSGNFELKEGDVLNLNFKENSFDIVVNNFMIDLMPSDSFSTIAKTFYRVLKPKGRLVISTFSFGTKNVHKFWFWVSKIFPTLLTGCRPIAFKSYLIEAGFEIEKIVEVSQNTFPSQVISALKGKTLIN